MNHRTTDERKEKLAAQLRENLRRRKTQGREQATAQDDAEKEG